MPSSRGPSQSRDQTQVSRVAGGFFIIWATREADICSLMVGILLLLTSPSTSTFRLILPYPLSRWLSHLAQVITVVWYLSYAVIHCSQGHCDVCPDSYLVVFESTCFPHWSWNWTPPLSHRDIKWEKGGMGRAFQGGDICIPMVDSCWCTAETNAIL